MVSILNKINKLEKYTKYSLYLIIIAFIIRLILSIITTPSGDACWHLSISRFIAREFAIPLFEPLGRDLFWAPPLFHILTSISYILFSGIIGEIALKLISPILGTIFLVYSFLLIKKLFNPKTAFYSTIFLTFIPIHVYHSSMGYADITAGLFIIASVYYLLEKRLAASSILAGLAFLTKASAVLILPVVIYIILKNYSGRDTVKKIIIFLMISIFISSGWYVRNMITFGYPSQPGIDSDLSFNIPTMITSFYLSMFGVPAGGNLNTLTLVNDTVLIAWFIVTLFFISFFLIGLRQLKRATNYNVLTILLLSFILFQVLYSLFINNSFMPTRLIIPALPFFSLYWAFGLEKTITRCKPILKNVLIILMIISIAVFLGAEFTKSTVASNMWNTYSNDFNWIKQNTPQNSIILTPDSQCYSYHFDRYTKSTSFFTMLNKTSLEDYKAYNITHIFYPEFEGTSLVISKFDLDMSEAIGNSILVYENNNTNIKIYKLIYD